MGGCFYECAVVTVRKLLVSKFLFGMGAAKSEIFFRVFFVFSLFILKG